FTADASNQCTVTISGTVHLTGAGSCTVKADQAGDANYTGAPQVTQTFSIVKATPAFSALSSQTITFGTPTKTLAGKLTSGALVPTGNVSITIGATPPITQQAALASDGTFSSSFNTSAIPVSSPYTVTYAFTEDNNFKGASDNSTTLTVTKADQTITFGA